MNPVKKISVIIFCITLFWFAMSASVFGQDTVLKENLGDFSLVKEISTYNPGNLFELINGQAVFYLSYGFIELEHSFYKKGDAIYQVDLYELRSDLSALGCYRQQKDMDSEPLAVGAEGSIIDYLTVFFKDRYYIEIIPFEGDVDDIIGEMTALAEHIDDCIPGDANLPDELSFFPDEGKTENSGLYIGENLLSYTFLGHGITAEYTVSDGKTFRAFISFGKSDEDARNIAAQFDEKLTDSTEITLPNGSAGKKGEMPYRGRALIVPYKSFAVGALGYTDDDAAIAVISGILDNVSSYNPDGE